MQAMDYAQAAPSLSQAQRLKKFSQEGKISLDVMCAIMTEEKKGEMDKVTIKNEVKKDSRSPYSEAMKIPSKAP